MKKYFSLLMFGLLFVILVDINKVYAQFDYEEVGTTEDGETIYVENISSSKAAGNTGKKVLWDHDPGYGYGTGIITISNVGYVYCIQPYVQFPTGNNYDGGSPYNNPGVLAILTYGFPTNYEKERDKYNFSDKQAYVKTFVAINAYLGNFNRKTVESAKDPYVNYLLKKGDKAYVPQLEFEIDVPKNISSFYNRELKRNETNEYSIKSNDVSVSNLPKSVEIELDNGVTIGNGQVLNKNQSFKFISSSSFEGDVNPTFSTPVKKRSAVIYKNSKTQNLVTTKMTNVLQKQSTNLKFQKEQLKTKLVVNKLGEDLVLLEGVVFEISTSKTFSNDVQTYVTDSEGKITIEVDVVQDSNVEYFIREKETLKEYVLDDKVYSVLIEAGETATIDLVNNFLYSKVVVRKVDDQSKTLLAGALLVLEKYDSINDNWVEYSKFLTTNEEYVFDKLSYGKYRLKELSAPEGYKTTDKYVEIEITENGEEFVISFENSQVLTKTGGINNVSIITILLLVFSITLLYYGRKTLNKKTR